MKTIILVRHAKSSWKFPELKDIDRPLRKRGVRDAQLMAGLLKELNGPVDHIISSPAVRALATAEAFAREFGLNEETIVIRENLYMESKNKMIEEIKRLDDKFTSVILVSHEPTITDLANLLTKDGSIDRIPTSGIAGIRFECDSWKDIEMKKGKQLFFEVPKTHRKKKGEKNQGQETENPAEFSRANMSAD